MSLLLLLVALNANTATIRGTVRDARGGGPVAGFDVAAFDRDGHGVSRAMTDVEGHYALVVPAGAYVVATADFFSAFGYRGQLWNGIDCGTQLCPLGSGDVIVVSADDVRDGIDFRLNRIIVNVVNGRVADRETAQPLSGASITMVDERTRGIFTATSGADGRFTIANVPSGRYTLRGAAPHYLATFLGGVTCNGYCSDTGQTLEVGDGDTNVELPLVRLTTVKVIAFDALTGAPVDDLQQVYISGGSARSVSGNTAIFVDELPGKKWVVATAKRHGATGGDSTACPSSTYIYTCSQPLFDIRGNEMTIVIRMQPYLAAHGRVFDVETGEGIEGATVNVSGDVTTTAADGSWSIIPKYEPRSGYVSASAPGYVIAGFGAPAGSGDVGTLVTLTPGVAPPALSMGLVRGGTFSGTVTDEMSGEPIAGATVTVGYTRGYERNEIRAVTDANGHFVTPQLIGAHVYSVHAAAAGYATSGSDGKPCLINCDYGGVPVTGAVKSDTSVNLALRKTGTIDVRMRCPDSTWQRPYGERYYDAAGRRVDAAIGEKWPRTLAAGDYYVGGYAVCGGGLFPDAPPFYDPDVTKVGKPVTVRPGETTVIEIAAVERYTRAPFEPEAAPASGGTIVTFRSLPVSSPRVFFGDAEAMIVRSEMNGRLEVALPSHAPGVVDVTLKSGSYVQVQRAAFTYTDGCVGISFNRAHVIGGARDLPALFTADLTNGSGPFQYEWFGGPYPSVAELLATTPSFVTRDPLRLIPRFSYWVRISNPCSTATMSFDVRGEKVRGVR